jgi:hypothetical protein
MSHPTEHLATVGCRKGEIENDRIKLRTPQQAIDDRTVTHAVDDVMVALERALHDLGQRRVVLGDENSHGKRRVLRAGPEPRAALCRATKSVVRCARRPLLHTCEIRCVTAIAPPHLFDSAAVACMPLASTSRPTRHLWPSEQLMQFDKGRRVDLMRVNRVPHWVGRPDRRRSASTGSRGRSS